MRSTCWRRTLFASFDAMAYSHRELTNFANIARDCGVDAKTVKEYYQILVDTLLGAFIEPYKKRQERQVTPRSRVRRAPTGVGRDVIHLSRNFAIGRGGPACTPPKGTGRPGRCVPAER